MSVLVSINCITYNHEKYIRDAIESFIMQKTTFDFEILIGEDCSTDGNRKIVDEYVSKFPNRIRLITSDNNVGAQNNLLRLFVNSKGKYIAICEGDDYWIDPYKLQKQVDYMESHSECSFCFHAAEIVQVDKKPTGNIMRRYNNNCISSTEDIIIRGGGFCPTASLLFPAKLIENLPEFYINAKTGDYGIQMILASKGYAFYIDKIMSAYRTGVPGSWTSQLLAVSNIETKIIKYYEDDIKLLDNFNKYSDYKYSNAVEKTKLPKQFRILLLNNKIKELKATRYKEFYNALGTKGKIKLHARWYFPKTYRLLKAIRYQSTNLEK